MFDKDWNSIIMAENSSGPWGRPSRPPSGLPPRGEPPYGRTPRGGDNGNPPPDFDYILNRLKGKLQGFFDSNGSFNRRGWFMLVATAVLLWLASGIYKINPDEQGVVLRFGKFERLADPGLRYHLPAPIETLFKPKVTRINKAEIGFRSIAGATEETQRPEPEESLMLTGDENIVDVNFVVQWKIRDAQKFLFNIRQPEMTVKNAAESAMRETIGQTPISTALGEGRSGIEQDTQKLLQSILDLYGAGIEIVRVQLLKADPPAAVIDAFRDVQTARADAERLVNQAEAYRNDILPRARGAAEQKILDSQAYKQRVVALSEGEAARFNSIYGEYKNSQNVTRERIYLETMESVMKGMNKMVVDDKIKGLLPMLPPGDMKPPSAKDGKNEQ